MFSKLFPVLTTFLGSFLVASVAFSFPLKKSPKDPNLYDAFVLKNKMKVVVVSNPKARMASAALSVDVGSLSDPKHLPGLAHFLEHTLFLGTAKYPNPQEFPSYVAQRNGMHNAFTSGFFTTYFFSVNPDFLPGALDRFSAMFVSPAFNKDYVDRELKAIQAEYSKNLNSDFRKIFQAFTHVYDASSPFAQFRAGNAATLQPKTILLDEVKKFYQDHYSSDQMSLVIVGKQSLAELRSMAKRYFEAVPTRPTLSLDLTAAAFDPSKLPSSLEVKTNKKTNSLALFFPIPSQYDPAQQKSFFYVASMLGDEGPKSLLEALKQEGLAQSLMAGLAEDNPKFSVLNVQIDLTEQGVKQQQRVKELFFAYAGLLQKEKVANWRIEEQQKLAELQFRFQEPQEADHISLNLVAKMPKSFDANLLYQDYDFSSFDGKNFDAIVASITPNNMISVLSSADAVTDKFDPFYETSYSLQKVEPASYQLFTKALQADGAANPNLALPAKNPYIPFKVDLIRPQDSLPKPTQISQTPMFELWAEPVADFKVPYASVKYRLFLPAVYKSPKNLLMARMWADLWNYKLNPLLYAAREVRSSYGIQAHKKGFDLDIFAYEQNLPKLKDDLFEVIFSKAKDPLYPKAFPLIKQAAFDRLKNEQLDTPLALGFYSYNYLAESPFWHRDTYLATIDSISWQDMEAFLATLYDEGKALAFVYGNFDIKNLDSLQANNGGMPFQKAALEPELSLSVFNAGGVDLKLLAQSQDFALISILQGKKRSEEEKTKFMLLERFVQQPFFHELRTVQQLGYIVGSGAGSRLGLNTLAFYVQSPEVDPEEIKPKLDQFLQDYAQTLTQLKDSEFKAAKKSLIDDLAKKPLTLAEGQEEMWGQLLERKYDFQQKQRLIADLQALPKKQFIAFAVELLTSPETRRLNLLVWDKKAKNPPPVLNAKALEQKKQDFVRWPEFPLGNNLGARH